MRTWLSFLLEEMKKPAVLNGGMISEKQWRSFCDFAETSFPAEPADGMHLIVRGMLEKCLEAFSHGLAVGLER